MVTADVKTEPITVNLGPQHPSTHGVFRMRVTFDGEVIVDVEPIFGYLHRGSEKLAEERTYVQVVTLTDRMDYVGSMLNNQAYMLAVETLCDVEPEPRGVWLRMIASELQRIASHLVAIGFLIQDLGAWGTPPHLHDARTRENIRPVRDALRRRALPTPICDPAASSWMPLKRSGRPWTPFSENCRTESMTWRTC